MTASFELGLPIALEFGIDILKGKFKESIALVDRPILFGSATVTSDKTSPCYDGIELRAGLKNRIYATTYHGWDYDFVSKIVYEDGIGCVT